eukprot:TRINITY_DN11246_c0_g1_i1.p1 TRINITY_DN11246_c0_g1~~TRINITY_DN11246_c0_g1_i1.p1  ORF type:complete len:172 (-),score=10.77 TRINITY_DN11246_c0_g1_i1:17-532(-)
MANGEVYVWEGNQIEEGLWLGSEESSHCKLSELKTKNITHILTVGLGIPMPHTGKLQYLHIKAIDLPLYNILQHFSACYEFIEAARASGGSVLVHCARGKSRSASVVIAYLMKKYNITFAEAKHRVRSARPIIDVNEGFHSQLTLYERMGCDTNGDTKFHEEYRTTYKIKK